jgi:general secretion pathway protein E
MPMLAASANSADVRSLVDELLHTALQSRASDLHVEPAQGGCEIRLRIDGLLETNQSLPSETGRAVVTRLMVMANLLTYRLDVPQEGRISFPGAELRLAVMPTIHGMRAALRMPADHVQPAILEDLALPPNVVSGLLNFAAADCGMLILTGPAGSGKTTTIYALLRHIAKTNPGLSIIALEDPVERNIPGVTQIEVSPFGQLTYEKALRSILRQDPQVLMLGEVRDAATGSIAVQAALSGHRLITALHAATPAGAIARLLEMGIEPYQLTSSVHSIVSQRLVRRISRQREPHEYQGRVPVAEFVYMDQELRTAVLKRGDIDALSRAYQRQTTWQSMREVAQLLVKQGITDDSELSPALAEFNRLASNARGC